MDQSVYHRAALLWDYMKAETPLEKSDVIIGFGCYVEQIGTRCAELYRQGWANKILFTGGLGRNTKEIWTRSEAERFADAAMAAGVPEGDILLETRSTNSAENILFSREILEPLGVRRFIGVHKPQMLRRVAAAMGVYWPGMKFSLTCPQLTLEQYIALSESYGLGETRVIEILAGDFQRMEVYAEKGYQLPVDPPEPVREAFRALVEMGYTADLVK